MVQHDNRVWMQGRQGNGAAVPRGRQVQEVNGMPILYDVEEEWYEEDDTVQGRNPYLEDYARQRSQRPARQRTGAGRGTVYGAGQPARRGTGYGAAQPARRGERRRQVEVPAVSGSPAPARRVRPSGAAGYSQRAAFAGGVTAKQWTESAGEETARRWAEPIGEEPVKGTAARRTAPARGAAVRRTTSAGGAASSRRAARARRRKRILMQRIIVCLWAVCVLLAAAIFLFREDTPVAGGNRLRQEEQENRADNSQASSILVQGIPAVEFAKHPEWEENFLTPNEYSRPGDPLESVKNIFVHYTANPGTSAAQNRSYFEQQKDVHQNSVSAHFIIGYEGEIIQCVPLDEVAYAVQTRNYDSISIECCHLEKDGSFTQETYDSLISLLAWLTDIYGLESEDILRHYDCGGKKCPLYYVEHEDAWKILKQDVADRISLAR